MIFGIFVIVSVLATASATKKADDSLLSALSKERLELKEVFRHENQELRAQDTQLRREDDQIRKRVEELQEQNVKLREEKLQEENNAVKKENVKLQDEITQLKKEVKKLRQVDRRQRDQIDNLTLEQRKKGVVRQQDVVWDEKKPEYSRMSDAITEVEITGGSASASSSYDNGVNYPPKKAFIRGNVHAGWISNYDDKNKGIFPQMVWYDFGQGNAFVPARVSFRGRTDCGFKGCLPETPSSWEFVGSNDDVCSRSGNWTVLCQDLSDKIPQDVTETKLCDVNYGNPYSDVRQSQGKYRCLGINVIRAHYQGGYTSLSNVRMWKNVIQTGGMKHAMKDL